MSFKVIPPWGLSPEDRLEKANKFQNDTCPVCLGEEKKPLDLKRVRIGNCGHWVHRGECYNSLPGNPEKSVNVSGVAQNLGTKKCPMCNMVGFGQKRGGMLTARQAAEQMRIYNEWLRSNPVIGTPPPAPRPAPAPPATAPVQTMNPLRTSNAPDASAIIPLAGIANATCSALGSCFGFGKKGGYKLRKAPKRELYWVIAEDGTKKSKEPLPLERAKAQMRALYASMKGGGFQFRKEGGEYVIFDDESGQIIKRLNTLGETLQLVRKYTKEGLPKIQKVYEPMEGEEEEVNEGAEVSAGGDQQYRTQLKSLLNALAPRGVISQQSLFENLRSFLDQSNPGHAFLIRLFPYLMKVRSDAPLSKLVELIGRLVPDINYYMKTPINKQKAYIEFMSGSGLRGGSRQQINFLISRVQQMERKIAAKKKKGEDTTDLEDQRLNALYRIQELENAIVYDDPQQEAQQDEDSEDPSGAGLRGGGFWKLLAAELQDRRIFPKHGRDVQEEIEELTRRGFKKEAGFARKKKLILKMIDVMNPDGPLDENGKIILERIKQLKNADDLENLWRELDEQTKVKNTPAKIPLIKRLPPSGSGLRGGMRRFGPPSNEPPKPPVLPEAEQAVADYLAQAEAAYRQGEIRRAEEARRAAGPPGVPARQPPAAPAPSPPSQPPAKPDGQGKPKKCKKCGLLRGGITLQEFKDKRKLDKLTNAQLVAQDLTGFPNDLLKELIEDLRFDTTRVPFYKKLVQEKKRRDKAFGEAHVADFKISKLKSKLKVDPYETVGGKNLRGGGNWKDLVNIMSDRNIIPYEAVLPLLAELSRLSSSGQKGAQGFASKKRVIEEAIGQINPLRANEPRNAFIERIRGLRNVTELNNLMLELGRGTLPARRAPVDPIIAGDVLNMFF